ncbi:MAG: caspase family protein [Alphaproteobacteria bacterium]|nr:caspase family protein [Alphaproteobacteria bacterium]
MQGLLWIALALATSLVNSPAMAERRVALVIGNGEYSKAESGWDPLPNVARDVTAIANILRQLGFDVVGGARRNLGRAEFMSALQEFGNKAQGADWALIYYAGHGHKLGEVNYLVPIDSKVSGDITLDALLPSVKMAKSVKLIISDACRVPVDQSSNAQPLGLPPDGTGAVFVYGAQAGMYSYDGNFNQNSPFMKALLRHIATDYLTLETVFSRVHHDVMAETKNYPRGMQVPTQYGIFPEEASFTSNLGPEPIFFPKNRGPMNFIPGGGWLVFFDWNNTNLSAQALATIDQVASAYKASNASSILLTGNSDTDEVVRYKSGLSLDRARAIRKELVKRGISAQAILVQARKDEDRLVPTGEGVREPQNRNVEIVLHGETPAPSISWQITNSTSGVIGYKLFAPDRKWVWPGANTAWTLKPGETANFKEKCLQGEKVCYGAWDTNGTWGLGAHGDLGCSKCCNTCGVEVKASPINLGK